MPSRRSCPSHEQPSTSPLRDAFYSMLHQGVSMAKSRHTMKFPESFDNSGDNDKHLFKFRLNKIPVVFTRSVAKLDYDRLRACMSQRTSSPSGRWDNGKLFILFDSAGYRCALNTSCVSLAQFLFNSLYTPPTGKHFSDENIRVVPVDGSPIMTLKLIFSRLIRMRVATM